MNTKKPYTWEEIKGCLIRELDKTNHILTFGTIGSCDVDHDIDLIITKKPESSTVDFYKELHALFDSINGYLNGKYGVKAIRFARSEQHVLGPHIANAAKNDLSFHTMVYTSFPQIEKDWAWALPEDEKIREILSENYKCLLGSVQDLFSEQFQKKNYYDHLYTFMYLYDNLNSRYPEKLLVEVMGHYFDYLFRKRLKLETPKTETVSDAKENFYKLCNVLDDLNKIKEGKHV